MKILIISDTHGYHNNLTKILDEIGTPDMLIHAGDLQGDEDYIEYVADCPIRMVSGNNDFSMSLKRELLFHLEDLTVYLTHGHQYGVHYGTDRLAYRASELGADIVIYGHTHVPSIDYYEDYNIWFINPGSLSLPRGGRRPSYILMEIHEGSEPRFFLKYI